LEDRPECPGFFIQPAGHSAGFLILQRKEGIEMKRKLITFAKDYFEKGKYYISFAYYDQQGRWTREFEETKLTEDQLYDLLKPFLEFKKETVKY
jgi:hypothetical protein